MREMRALAGAHTADRHRAAGTVDDLGTLELAGRAQIRRVHSSGVSRSSSNATFGSASAKRIEILAIVRAQRDRRGNLGADPHGTAFAGLRPIGDPAATSGDPGTSFRP